LGAIGHDGLAVPGKVELAHEPPFRLGILQVEPATRQLTTGERSETLEPRVMQVLVALYRAGGIVTRDELVERCWDGRVVGDDAINRVLSRIRHLASDIGSASFQVETITKVGYRLITEGLHSDVLRSGRVSPPALSRRAVTAGVTSAVIAGVAGVAWWAMRTPPGPPAEAKALFDRAIALRGGDSPDNRQAIAFLRQAVQIAPDYGEAWGALALAYRSAIIGEPAERVAGFEERLAEAVRNAQRYDPGNADAEIALRIGQPFFGQWTRMERVYRDLVRRQPAHATSHYLLGSLLMDVGRWREAVDALQRSKEANEFLPITRYKLIVSLWAAGRITEAEAEIGESFARWPEHGAIWQTKVKILAMTGRPEAALSVVNDASVRPHDETEEDVGKWRLFLTALASRSETDVNRAVARLTDNARRDPFAAPYAFQCAVLGRKEIALDILEGTYLGIGPWASKKPADPSSGASHPLFQPQASSIWREPRFNRILDGVGLERYWAETRTVPDYRRH
jgi:DNA-binding winged helix-turn-helix (wHTH) protein/tetratricopeptide (TPR) repeat protein